MIARSPARGSQPPPDMKRRPLPRLLARWRRARRRTTWRDFARLGVVFLVLAACGVAYHSSGIVFNHTGSMPIGFYQVRRLTAGAPPGRAPRELARGALVMWCLPERLIGEARRRGYLGGGACQGGVEPILKTIAAVPGDTVVVDSSGLAVNGRRLPSSHAIARDSRGRPIRAMPPGRYVVGPAEAWVWSPYTPLSFDSRYYGALPFAGLVGFARPVWTRHQPLPRASEPGAGLRREGEGRSG